MSYDLFLYPKAFDPDAVRAHFGARANYKMFDKQAWYENEDTGVSFAFDFEDGGAEGEAGPHLAFTLNYCRPHVFGLEAEPELASFLAAIDCRIHDAQAYGMGEGPYSRESFLSAWNAGNRMTFEMMADHGPSPPPWPAGPALIEAIWLWNLRRAERQEQVGDRMFVPKVRWASEKNAAPVVTIAWTEGVPTLIPADLVTHVIMVRQPRPSMKQLFGAIRGKQDTIELKMVGLKAVAASHEVVETVFDGERIVQTPQSTAIIASIGAWPKPDLRTLPPEDVCGADLVALMKSLPTLIRVTQSASGVIVVMRGLLVAEESRNARRVPDVLP